MSNKNKKPNQKKKKNPKLLTDAEFNQLINRGWTTKLDKNLKESFGPSYVKVINKKTGLPDVDKSYKININNRTQREQKQEQDRTKNMSEKRNKIRNKEAVGRKGGGMIGKNKIIKGYKKGGKI